MKRILALAVVSMIICTACTKAVTGDGPTLTETRTVAHFSSIVLNDDATVEIIQSNGPDQKVTVSGYDNLLRIYNTTVQNDELTLEFQSGYYNIRKNNIHIVIETPDLHAVRMNGSGEAILKNFASGTQLNAGINGSGYIGIQNSSFDMLTLVINGSGRINASTAQTRDADVKVTGSGNIEVHCKHKLKMVIVGSGNIDYYGNPVTADVSVSGSGKVRKK